MNVAVCVGKRCDDLRGLFQRGFGLGAGRRDEMGGRSCLDGGKGSCGNSQSVLPSSLRNVTIERSTSMSEVSIAGPFCFVYFQYVEGEVILDRSRRPGDSCMAAASHRRARVH